MFRIQSVRSLMAAFAITLTSVTLYAQTGKSAKSKPSRNTDLETRIRNLEITVADLVDRIKRLESHGGNKGNEGEVPSIKSLVEGRATILADDGTFLGIITDDSINPKSVTNDVGRHGSTISAQSIFNDIGKYGSDVSATSARNGLASRPPKVYLNDKFVGFLTTNKSKSPRIDTDALIVYLQSQR